MINCLYDQLSGSKRVRESMRWSIIATCMVELQPSPLPAAHLLKSRLLCCNAVFSTLARLLTPRFSSLGHVAVLVLHVGDHPGRTRSREGFACPDCLLLAHSGLSCARNRLHLPQDAAPTPVLELAAAAAFHARGTVRFGAAIVAPVARPP